jgi:hypothetical protein
MPLPASFSSNPADIGPAFLRFLSTATLKLDFGTGSSMHPAHLTADMRLMVEPGVVEAFRGHPCSVLLVGEYVTCRCHLTHLGAWNPNHIAAQQIEILINRRMSRRPSPRGARARLFLPEGDLVCDLLDISLDGLKLLAHRRPIWDPGDNEFEVEITWKGGTPFQTRGRRVDDMASPGGHTLRISVTDERWADKIEPVLYSGVVSRNIDAEQLWQLYQAAGYFNLSHKTASDFSELRDHYAEVTRCLSTARDIGIVAVRPGHGRAEATVTQLRFWERGWMIMHLARYPAQRSLDLSDNAVLLDIYRRAYEHVAVHDPEGFSVFYVQDGAGFSKYCHLDFLARQDHRDDILRQHVQVYEFDVEQTLALGHSSPHLEPCSATERDDLLEQLAKDIHPVLAASQSLCPREFCLPGVTERFGKAGLVRQRAMLSDATANTSLAVLDHASRGAHLFGLCDRVSLFEFGDCPRELDRLVASAARWYSERQVERFTVFATDDQAPRVAALATRSLGGATRGAIPISLVPLFLEYMKEITVPRPKVSR